MLFRKDLPLLEKKVQGLMEKLDMVHHSDTGSRTQPTGTVSSTSQSSAINVKDDSVDNV